VKEVVHQSWEGGGCGNTCGQFASQAIGTVTGSWDEGQQSQLLALLVFPFPSPSTNKLHFPGPVRPEELPGASLETIPLQQDFASACGKRAGGKAISGKNLICR